MATVLLVEDEKWLGELYVALLQKAGHLVRWHQDAYEAMDAVDAQRPDVIVLDLLLPWANGIGLLHELASYGDLNTIPVIIYSNALPARISLQQLQPYGVRALLDKATSKPNELVATVERLLRAA